MSDKSFPPNSSKIDEFKYDGQSVLKRSTLPDRHTTVAILLLLFAAEMNDAAAPMLDPEYPFFNVFVFLV